MLRAPRASSWCGQGDGGAAFGAAVLGGAEVVVAGGAEMGGFGEGVEAAEVEGEVERGEEEEQGEPVRDGDEGAGHC